MSKLPSLFGLPSISPPNTTHQSASSVKQQSHSIANLSVNLDPTPQSLEKRKIPPLSQPGALDDTDGLNPSKRARENHPRGAKLHTTTTTRKNPSNSHQKQTQQNTPFVSLIGSLAYDLPKDILTRLPRDMSAESMAEWVAERRKNYPRLNRGITSASSSAQPVTSTAGSPSNSSGQPSAAMFAYQDSDDTSSDDGVDQSESDGPPQDEPILTTDPFLHKEQQQQGVVGGDATESIPDTLQLHLQPSSSASMPHDTSSHQDPSDEQHPCSLISQYIRYSTRSLPYNPFNSLCVILDGHAPPTESATAASSTAPLPSASASPFALPNLVKTRPVITSHDEQRISNYFQHNHPDEVISQCQYYVHNATLPPELKLKQLGYRAPRMTKQLHSFKNGTKSQQAFYRSKMRERTQFMKQKKALQQLKHATPYVDLYQKLLAVDLAKHTKQILHILRVLLDSHSASNRQTTVDPSTTNK